jgi:hypothetical protein
MGPINGLAISSLQGLGQRLVEQGFATYYEAYEGHKNGHDFFPLQDVFSAREVGASKSNQRHCSARFPITEGAVRLPRLSQGKLDSSYASSGSRRGPVRQAIKIYSNDIMDSATRGFEVGFEEIPTFLRPIFHQYLSCGHPELNVSYSWDRKQSWRRSLSSDSTAKRGCAAFNVPLTVDQVQVRHDRPADQRQGKVRFSISLSRARDRADRS